jgi:hypothetical protein
MRSDEALQQAVWNDLVRPPSRESAGATLSGVIEHVAPLYFDPRFRCFSKAVYRRLNAGPAFSYRFEAIRRADGVRVAGEIDAAAATSGWRKLLSATPLSGAFYRIASGDTLLGVAGRAYSARNGWGAQYINFHPFNRRLWRTDLADARLWPRGRISFSPRFASDLDTQATTRAGVAAAPRGGAFGVIFIPHAAWELEIRRDDLSAGRVDILRFDVHGMLELEKLPPPP